MSITAEDIQKQGFEHSLRGYDVNQVDVFLERVAQEVDALNAEVAQLKEKAANAMAAAAAAEAAVQPEPEPVVVDDTARIEAEARAEAAVSQAEAATARSQELQAQLNVMAAQITNLEKELAQKSETDTAISNAFISAQRAADSLKEEARAEGERIYRESEAKARDFIREALIEKQRILNETEALTVSCNKFRAEYRSLLDRFSSEADANFGEIQTPVVTEAAIDEAMPSFEPIEIVDDVPEPAAVALAVEDDIDIEEID